MAHSIYSTEEEIALIAERGVFVAHCPASNTNLSSGIAPVRHLLNAGVQMGLGSDVAGGHSLSMLRACADAVQCSKLRWRLADQSLAPLTAEEAFFLATRGGGAFFGKVGSFEPGFCFDALVLDDAAARTPLELTPEQRLRRSFYLGGDCRVRAKYVEGEKLY
jgi:guanine deaminase